MAKRSAASITGGTSESVAAALASTEATQPTDDQLDLLLPTTGFEVVAPPLAREKKPTQMSADEVQAFFAARLGPQATAFDAMRAMDLDELEELQGIADDVRAGGADDTAREKGLEWSTLIGTFIA